MNKFEKYICKYFYKIVLFAAIVSANVTCLGRYYQEEVDEQLDGLRRYKDWRSMRERTWSIWLCYFIES